MARFAHLDDAGVSTREPIAVVAGILSNPDRQWKALEQYLLDMAEHHLPADLRERGVIFHAKDIWHGTKDFPRDRFTREKRVKILEDLADIPKKFDIPVVLGAIQKSEFEQTKNHNELCYSMAFALCAVSIEYFMRDFAEASEIASLIAEDCNEMRTYAKWGYQRLKEGHLWAGSDSKLLPVTRIVEQPLFAKKNESSILQVADTIAFLSCRRLSGNLDIQSLFDRFSANLVSFPSWSDAAPPGGRTLD